ncbi:ATP-binding cassette domain-containing protein [Aquimarina sp. D1M17]|uniref:ABC transporter ATP-binding protein n=1 Tax=Aquimarina acroporae TaxID=2937283 RepID=UPI0020BDE983|nr:ATP-binding cassette domain-containing protein [Aquimarina acroporae]MCK8522024.1 ATP-binding cassette domain-containing protein [Aquimarina acroporae]
MIQIRGLKFHYPKSRVVLNDISLDFSSGNIYGLFGENGEGKSTLIKLMAGLLFPKKGYCQMSNNDLSKRRIEDMREVFMVPEDFELPSLSIHKFEKINAPFYPKFSQDQFYDLIREFKLSPQENLSALSFGQKKKVLIAFGVSANTSLLLLDEPTNGLDIPSKSQFRKIMASAVDEGKCIVISTHQVRDLHSLINHVVILGQSKVVFDQPFSSISEKLWFGRAKQDRQDQIIYTEPSFGSRAVLERLDQEETEVDLELLFNAVVSNPERINNVVKGKMHGTVI